MTFSRRPPLPRRPPVNRWHLAARELIDEITTAADRIATARTVAGERVYPTDGDSRLLRLLERSPYCVSISDAAWLLGVSRQAAHVMAHAAADAGFVELLPHPDDRRILQIFLTPLGRMVRKAAATNEAVWLVALLAGLRDQDIATTTHVVKVVRQRLERNARELAHAKRIPLESRAPHWGNDDETT